MAAALLRGQGGGKVATDAFACRTVEEVTRCNKFVEGSRARDRDATNLQWPNSEWRPLGVDEAQHRVKGDVRVVVLVENRSNRLHLPGHLPHQVGAVAVGHVEALVGPKP